MLKSVLWLASWYPNRIDSFEGDFVERHAMAASRFAKLTVLYVAKDETLKNNTVEIDKSVAPNLTVYKVYYGRSGWGGMLEQLLSYKKYIQLQKKLYRQIVKETGLPDLVHVQVAMKAGLLARWLKKIYHIPFIVTEHWSGYNPQTEPNIYNGNGLIKALNKKVLDDASLFLPVSDNLGKIVNQHFTSIRYSVVPNVVNTALFCYKPAVIKKFRFIHPSTMIQIKNPEGILKAAKIVKEKGYDFELLMVGNREERLVSLSNVYGLSEQVNFEAAVPYPEVAKQMQQSSALLLFSHFENLPCVVLEALCCGLPVVSSRVGGIPELIDDENGILVESENITALAGAMIQMMQDYAGYNHAAISAKATALFSYDTIGKQYSTIYDDILGQQ
ncbi:MAG: glycosyltransferase [Ferruginibacter sp.]